jgi:hypothetical protein
MKKNAVAPDSSCADARRFRPISSGGSSSTTAA